MWTFHVQILALIGQKLYEIVFCPNSITCILVTFSDPSQTQYNVIDYKDRGNTIEQLLYSNIMIRGGSYSIFFSGRKKDQRNMKPTCHKRLVRWFKVLKNNTPLSETFQVDQNKLCKNLVFPKVFCNYLMNKMK